MDGNGQESTTRRKNAAPTAFICMGVSGAGKTTVGNALAELLKCEFLDADDFHSTQNKEKMRKGIPLTDEDRAPWLETLRQALRERLVEEKNVVLACSALKPAYRTILRAAASDFGHEQARAVGETLDRDHAYVDGIPKEVYHNDENERDQTIDGQQNQQKRVSDLPQEYTGHAPDLRNGQEEQHATSKVVFVYLRVAVEVLEARLKAREKAGTHYMPASLLQSQMQTLEIADEEAGILTVDATLPPKEIARQIIGQKAT